MPPPYPYDRLTARSAIGRGPRGRRRGPLGGHARPTRRPPAVVEALAPSGARAGLPAVGRLARASARRRPAGCGAGWASPSSPPSWPPASAPRSWWPACPSGCACARPDRDTVLYPAVSYPTYAMGATLAGCRAVAVPVDERFRLDLAPSTRPTPRGRCACGSTPRATPPAASTTWRGGGLGSGPRRAGVQRRVLRRVHLGRARPAPSSSTAPTGWWRSTRCPSAPTWPGSGSASTPATPSWCDFLSEVRKHAGFMVAGPVQAAAVAAWDDDDHVEAQRGRYRRRLERMQAILGALGHRRRAARRRLLPVGAGPGRRRLGLRPPAGHRGRGAGQPGRVLRGGRAPTTSAWPWSGPTTSSSWWPGAWAWPDSDVAAAVTLGRQMGHDCPMSRLAAARPRRPCASGRRRPPPARRAARRGRSEPSAAGLLDRGG